MRRARPLTRVNIIAADYVYGLRKSRALVASALADAGFDVRLVRPLPWHWKTLRRFDRWRPGGADVNVFLERPHPELYRLARHQVVVPNQEWFFELDVPALERAAVVPCKTRHAEAIFTRLGARTAYVSFTSSDHRRHDVERHLAFLCIGAKQPERAQRVAALWSRHPEWPRLTLTTEAAFPSIDLPNVRHLRGYRADEEIVRLQNEHWFHLCLSAAEGFGHKIGEGMSCGAIVVAIDGAPMNELVADDRGLLVPATSSRPLRMGTAFDFDDADLEGIIEAACALPEPEVARRGARARAWFEENDRFFRAEFPRAIRALMG